MGLVLKMSLLGAVWAKGLFQCVMEEWCERGVSGIVDSVRNIAILRRCSNGRDYSEFWIIILRRESYS